VDRCDCGGRITRRRIALFQLRTARRFAPLRSGQLGVVAAPVRFSG
jgi:hypothetical protein